MSLLSWALDLERDLDGARVGMRREGLMRAHIFKWREFHDLECYGMLKTDPR